MANNRELSQFAAYVEVNDTTRHISIASTSGQYVGIGSTLPKSKLDIVGNVVINGITTASVLHPTTLSVGGTSAFQGNVEINADIDVSNTITLGSPNTVSIAGTNGVVQTIDDGRIISTFVKKFPTNDWGDLTSIEDAFGVSLRKNYDLKFEPQGFVQNFDLGSL